MQIPLITAHAGCEGTKANSLSSIIKGIAVGADIIEVDLRTTADGVMVLSHDDNIEGLSGKITISQSTYHHLMAEVSQLVTLEEAIQVIGQHHRGINMDIKDVRDYEKLYALIKDYNMVENVVITGCHYEEAALAKKHMDTIRLYLSAEDDYLEKHPDHYEEFVIRTVYRAKNIECEGINLYYLDCKEALIKAAQDVELEISVWTIDEPSHMETYLQLGVANITTNKVVTLGKLRQGIH